MEHVLNALRHLIGIHNLFHFVNGSKAGVLNALRHLIGIHRLDLLLDAVDLVEVLNALRHLIGIHHLKTPTTPIFCAPVLNALRHLIGIHAPEHRGRRPVRYRAQRLTASHRNSLGFAVGERGRPRMPRAQRLTASHRNSQPPNKGLFLLDIFDPHTRTPLPGLERVATRLCPPFSSRPTSGYFSVFSHFTHSSLPPSRFS